MDNFNFFTDRIVCPAGDSPTFEEWLAKEGYLKTASSEEKTASEAKPGLGQDCDGEPRGQMRGQVINNDNESEEVSNGSPMEAEAAAKAKPVKEAECGKEMGESDDAGKVTEKHTEAAPGNDKNKEPKVLINNDPNYQKGESTGKKKSEKSEKAASSNGFKKVACLDRGEKLEVFAKLVATTGKDGNSAYPFEYVEAMLDMKFANLTEEEKTKLKDFWLTMYGPEYVDAMLKDR